MSSINKSLSLNNQYSVKDPYKQYLKTISYPYYKKILNPIFRPFWNFKSKFSVKEYLKDFPKESKIIAEKGYPIEFRRYWATKELEIKNSTVMVHGTGNGWDVFTWAKMRPKSIIAIDLFEFNEWEDVAKKCKDKWNVKVDFFAASLNSIPNIKSNSIDLIVSDAVYEHCQDMEGVIKESNRVLKVNGLIYANYGPLYYSAGGDHISGNDDLSNRFNHIMLKKSEYKKYIKSMKLDNEDIQGGYRYVELDLFSKLTTQEYIDIYKNNSFQIEDLWIEINSQAIKFKKKFPDKFNNLLKYLPEKCSKKDLFIKSHHIKIKKITQ